MREDRAPRLTAVHRALADPLRIRLYELLATRPRSAKELADRVGMRADRLYHHLAQLEDAKLIEVASYRRLAGGKAERVYAPTVVEPPGDDSTPEQVALFLSAVLETTRADVNAAALAQEAGEDRKIALGRTVLRLNDQHLAQLRTQIEKLLLDAGEHPDEDGAWSTVLWATVDREDRNPQRGTASGISRSGGSERRTREPRITQEDRR